eukprot:Lithocolla_globosa_v1_NODE_5961_length_1157_cov_15.433757.p1 type:complete len:359 gc:universal NODE_5961_length_1157_cov_15.433757:1131-55(-)
MEKSPPSYSEGQSMDDVLQSATSLQEQNQKLIKEILTCDCITTYFYELDFSKPGEGSVIELKQEMSLKDYLSEYENKQVKLEEMFDLFNDKIGWKMEKWDEVVTINTQLGQLVVKFGMLRDNPQSQKMCVQLENNLKKIKALLEDLLRLVTAGQSRMQNMQAQVTKINELTQSLMAQQGVRQQPKIPSVILTGSGRRGDLNSQLNSWYPGAWTLLYRGSRDGFEATQFHSKCDHQGPTCTIIKSEGGWVFGGYASVSWNGSANGFLPDEKASLFSLINPRGTSPTLYSWFQNQGLFPHSGYGPVWGGAHDLCVSNQANTNNNSFTSLGYSYRDTTGHGKNTFTGQEHFKVTELEVFKI